MGPLPLNAITWDENHRSRFRLYFEVNIPKPHSLAEFKLLSATLKLYKSVFSVSLPKEFSLIQIYYTLPPSETKTQNLQRVLLVSKNITLNSSGWESFNFSDIIYSAILSISSDFVIEIESPDINVSRIFKLSNRDELDVKNSTRTHQSDYKPQLDILVESFLPHRRTKRSKKKSKSKHNCPRGKDKRCCRPFPLEVSFKEIGWDWVVIPETFNAYYCSGNCPYGYNPTNTHAVIQSFVKHILKENVPKLCCTPKKLSSLKLIHWDGGSPPNLISSEHDNMIVEECSCA